MSASGATNRPQALEVVPEKIPATLTALDQWACWRWEKRAGKWTKPPIDPATGGYARNNDPETWASFEAALWRMSEHHLAGVGFMFHPEDGLAGVDLDHCRNPKSGEIEPWAREIVSALDSYAELSPSGTGLKVFVCGELPPGRKRKGSIEMYDRGRFFTTTGHRLECSPAEVRDGQEALSALHARLFGSEQAEPAHGGYAEGPLGGDSAAQTLADAEIVEMARHAANGEKFTRLYFEGDTEGYATADNDGHSEADLALCSLLAFWCGPDEGRIERLFRSSALCREKWKGRPDYRQLTISVALDRSSAGFYSGRRRVGTKARRVRRAGA